ncbi:hypothetical protein FN846DRAFT_192755 [Sphaerosporella brunnea]|uniref:Uncharacterized protein n=1 Tax=Sphaerosporella brunnea TaxID=1250544 RepID=A0A5J5EPV9_9PEZI|nr:hypothetical protein FN846DRAFT_192755 [Sphaerosporella brunnea]
MGPRMLLLAEIAIQQQCVHSLVEHQKNISTKKKALHKDIPGLAFLADLTLQRIRRRKPGSRLLMGRRRIVLSRIIFDDSREKRVGAVKEGKKKKASYRLGRVEEGCKPHGLSNRQFFCMSVLWHTRSTAVTYAGHKHLCVLLRDVRASEERRLKICLGILVSS